MPLPYPAKDPEREDRIVARVLDRLHIDAPQDADEARVKTWLKDTLAHAARNRRLWFLVRQAATVLPQGADVVDFTGQVHKVAAVFAPCRLTLLPLEEIVALRTQAQFSGKPNAGTPGFYAIEAGLRLHLWPAPAAVSPETPFALTFTASPSVDIVPDHWEGLLADGMIGMYGRHWDKAQLVDDADQIEARYLKGLRDEASPGLDVAVIDPRRPARRRAGATVASPQSAVSAATTVVAPASVTGIGFVTIQTGPYPLEVA